MMYYEGIPCSSKGKRVKMSTASRIFKNTSVLALGQIISYVLGFFYIVYIVRYLGAEKFGMLSFALALSAIVKICIDFGLDSLAVREISRNRSLGRKYLGNIFAVKLILSIICILFILLMISFSSYSVIKSKVIFFIFLSVIIGSFSSTFNSLFSAYEKMEYISVGTIINSALMLIVAFSVISRGYDVVILSLLTCVVSLVNLLYAFTVCVWKFVIPSLKIDFKFIHSLTTNAWPFFLSAVVDIIAFKIDVIMLSYMKGDLAVGYYSVAYKFLEVLMFIPSAFVGALFPIFSNFYFSSKESLKLLYEKSFKYLSIVGLPIAVGTTLLAERIIFFVYKEGFSESVIILKVLIWTVPIIFLSYILGTFIASINKQVVALKINFLCMLLNIGLNLVLIPKYSSMGASIATVITSFLSLILCFYYISRHVCKIQLEDFALKTIIANLAMGLFILIFINMNLLLLIAVSIIMYFGVLFVLRVLSKKDYELLIN